MHSGDGCPGSRRIEGKGVVLRLHRSRSACQVACPRSAAPALTDSNEKSPINVPARKYPRQGGQTHSPEKPNGRGAHLTRGPGGPVPLRKRRGTAEAPGHSRRNGLRGRHRDYWGGKDGVSSVRDNRGHGAPSPIAERGQRPRMRLPWGCPGNPLKSGHEHGTLEA